MKFEIWSEGDRSVGIPSSGASVEIDNLEEWGDDEIMATKEILYTAFKAIFDDTRIYIIEATETGVIDR